MASARVWQADTGLLLSKFKHEPPHNAYMEFSPDNQWAISYSYDNRMRVWEMPLIQPSVNGDAGLGTTVIQGKPQELTASDNGMIAVLWRVKYGIFTGRFNPTEYSSVTFSPDGLWAACITKNNTVRILDQNLNTAKAETLEHPTAGGW